MISVAWHFIVFIAIELALIVGGGITANNEHGMFAGIGCFPYLLAGIFLFLLYGGIFLW